jgi:hypothetical protein
MKLLERIEDNCRKSNDFAWAISIIAVLLMILIARW